METSQDQSQHAFIEQFLNHLAHEVNAGEQKKAVEFTITPIPANPQISGPCYKVCYVDSRTHTLHCTTHCIVGKM